jgi:hypothetical protein
VEPFTRTIEYVLNSISSKDEQKVLQELRVFSNKNHLKSKANRIIFLKMFSISICAMQKINLKDKTRSESVTHCGTALAAHGR